MIIIPIKWLFHWEYTLFSDKPISEMDIATEIVNLLPEFLIPTMDSLVRRLQRALHAAFQGVQRLVGGLFGLVAQTICWSPVNQPPGPSMTI